MANSGNYAFWSGANESGNLDDTPTFDKGSTYFYVQKDGKLSCKNAEVRGNITADRLECNNGEIGGWQISEGILKSTDGKTELRSNNSVSLHTSYGDIGIVEGDSGSEVTYNFGLTTTNKSDGNKSIILKSANNIALRTENGTIYLEGKKLECTVPAADQSGIYAQFL